MLADRGDGTVRIRLASKDRSGRGIRHRSVSLAWKREFDGGGGRRQGRHVVERSEGNICSGEAPDHHRLIQRSEGLLQEFVRLFAVANAGHVGSEPRILSRCVLLEKVVTERQPFAMTLARDQ